MISENKPLQTPTSLIHINLLVVGTYHQHTVVVAVDPLHHRLVVAAAFLQHQLVVAM